MSTEVAAANAPDERAADDAAESPGQSLRSLLDLCAWLDCHRAAEIALGVAEQLDEAERSGASPLGPRPENIFVSDDGAVTVAFSDQPRGAASRAAALYLSPEEVRGEAADLRSDLYALGVVLYEMLTDRVPFDGRDAEAVMQKHLHRTPEPPKIFRADVPDALSKLVMRLLEKDVERRPQHAADLFGELRRVIEAATAAARGHSASAERDSDIFVLTDYAPAHRGGQGIDIEDDAVLDLEFNDLFADGLSVADDAEPDVREDEPPITAPVAAPVIASPPPDEPVAEFADRRPASLLTEVERDPFDVPALATAVGPRAPLSASAYSEDLRPEARDTRERQAPAESGDVRLRWLALVIVCVVAAAALFLYAVIRPAATKSNDPVTLPQQTPAAEAPQAGASEGAARTAPSNSPGIPDHSAASSRNASPAAVSHQGKATAPQLRRKAGGSRRPHSAAKRKKRGPVRRAAQHR